MSAQSIYKLQNTTKTSHNITWWRTELVFMCIDAARIQVLCGDGRDASTNVRSCSHGLSGERHRAQVSSLNGTQFIQTSRSQRPRGVRTSGLKPHVPRTHVFGTVGLTRFWGRGPKTFFGTFLNSGGDNIHYIHECSNA